MEQIYGEAGGRGRRKWKGITEKKDRKKYEGRGGGEGEGEGKDGRMRRREDNEVSSCCYSTVAFPRRSTSFGCLHLFCRFLVANMTKGCC